MLYKITKENNKIIVKNGNECHIVMLKHYDNDFLYTSFKKYPMKNFISAFDLFNYKIIKKDNVCAADLFLKENKEKQLFANIQSEIEKKRMQYVLKTKRNHQIKFRTEVLVQIEKNKKIFIHDSVAKVDDKFVYFDTWKCHRSNIYCIVLPNGKRKFRFKFNKHEQCNYNVDNVPLIHLS